MNTCYYYQDLLPRPVRGLSTARFDPTGVSALLVYSMIAQVCLLGTLYQGLGLVWLHRLNLVHFQGYSIRLVSCYALLSRCRLPWPLPSCQYGATPFNWWVPMLSRA